MAKKPATAAFVLEGSFLQALTAIAGVPVFNTNAGDEIVAELVKQGLVELNTAGTLENGQVPGRATDKGREALAALSAGGSDEGDNNDTDFEIEESEEHAVNRSRTGLSRTKAETYPFSKLAAPRHDDNGKRITAKFFVPNTDGNEMHKVLSSTVSAASRRFATETGETREVNRKVTEQVHAVNTDGTPKYNEQGQPVMTDREVTKKVSLPVLNYERKFRIYAGEKNGVKGAWIEREK